MKNPLVTLMMILGGLLTARATEPAAVTPAQADTWLAATPAAQVLDVRDKEEFAGGHLANATLIPWTGKDFAVRAAKELDPRKPVLVYCNSGRRSTEAATALVKLGFSEVRNLTGGILAWQQAEKTVIKPVPTPGLPRQAVPDTIRTLHDIPYADTPNTAQRLDLYLPGKPRSDKPLPVIVFIHGGGWQGGNKASGRGSVLPFVTSGEYAGASVEYRLSGEAKWPAQIEDCKAAIRWIKAHSKENGLDPEKIAVWGTSAGGHLVAMLGDYT